MSSGASLNHIFRTVWNQALGAMVAVAETGTSGRTSGRRIKSAALQKPPEVGVGLLALSIAVAWSAWTPSAHANPTGGVAVAGQATMVNTGNKLQVTTQNGAGTNFSAINWQSFSIPAGSSTYFQQPSVNSTSINRVVTNTPTQLFGTLSSNGSLVLVNQSGIAVGAGAVVDTAGFTASSLAMSDQDAMAGRLRFGNGSISTADVSVNGTVLARSGDVVLLGPNVQTGQDALIQAPNGNAILAAGQQIDITERGLEGIRLQVQAPTNSVVNLGSLKGDAVGLFAGTLKHSGLIQATAVSDSGGRVTLKADELLNVSGQVSAQRLGGMGGEVLASADKVLLQSSAVLDASGANGGGEVLVGGGWQGHDSRLNNASQTVVAKGARISADALVQGDGGTTVVWSDGATHFGGSVSARGGEQGGNGGKAEVSGKQFLNFKGAADLSARNGLSGLLLLDPDTLTIGANADANGDGSAGDDVIGDASFGASGYGSQITAAQVGLLLNSASLTLSATGDVTVASPVTKSSGGATTLSLTSDSGNIFVNSAISGSIGSPLNLNLSANSSINVAATINTKGGNVSLVAVGGTVIQAASISAAALYASAAGPITLSNAGNAVAAFSGTSTGGGIDFTTSGAVSLGALSPSFGNNLQIYAGGAITQTAPVTGLGYGSAVFNASSGGIALTQTGNDFGAGVSVFTTAGNATVSSNSGVILGTSSVGGTLSVISAGGAITQTGPVTASTLDLTLGSGGFASLTDSGNLVNTLKISKTGTEQIDYFNNASLSLGPITTGGNLTVDTVALSNISQSGAISVGGTGIAYLRAGDQFGGYGSLVLMNSANNFNAVTLAGSQVSVLDSNALTVNGLYTSTGTALIQAGGNLTLSGSMRSDASGDAFKFVSGGTFSGSGGFFNFGTAGARWLAYLTTQAGQTFPSFEAPAFKQYNATLGSTVLGTGNGVLYSVAPFLTGSLSGAVSKIYDGGLSISPSGATVGALGGALGFDDISAAVASATAANLSDPNVGSGKTVTVSGPVSGVLGGSSDPVWFAKPIYGYQFSASGNIGTVTPAQASVSLTGTRAYDGTNIVAANIFSIGGLANNETLNLSGAGSVADKNVGANKVVTLDTLTLADGTGLASNYTFTGGTHLASITPAVLSVTGGSRVYDGTSVVSSGLLALSGLVASETLALSGSGAMTDKNVGANKPVSLSNLVLVNGSGLASNYTLAGVSSAVTVTARPVTPIAITAENKVYDGNTSATLSGGQVSGAISGDLVTLSGSGNFSDKNAGVGKIVTASGLSLSGADAGNYSLATANALTTNADITPKTLDVSGLTAANKEYNGKLDAVAGTGAAVMTGLIAGDAVALANAQGTFSDKDVGVGKTVIFSGFGLTGPDGGNYKVGSSNSAKADITARPLSSWIGGVSGLWSDPNNWDVIPDGANVLAVNVPSGLGAVTVTLVRVRLTCSHLPVVVASL